MPIPDLTKATQDVIGATIVAGTNVTATYSETAGTVTIASSGGAASARETFMDCQEWRRNPFAFWAGAPGLNS